MSIGECTRLCLIVPFLVLFLWASASAYPVVPVIIGTVIAVFWVKAHRGD